MNVRDIVMIGIAAATGFVGGLPARYVTAAAEDSSRTIRATRFELIDSAGTVRAIWGLNERKELVLCFVQDGHERAALGVMTGDSPFVRLASKQGEHRASLVVYGDRPGLAMSDARLEGRLRLGAVSYDEPSPNYDGWALTFNGTDGRGALASIGLLSSKEAQHGFLRVRDAHDLVWPQ